MIWAWLLFWVASANEWMWAVVGEVLDASLAGHSYAAVAGVRTLAARASGFGFLPWQVMVTWVALVFTTYGVVLVLGVIRVVLRVLMGNRNPAE